MDGAAPRSYSTWCTARRRAADMKGTAMQILREHHATPMAEVGAANGEARCWAGVVAMSAVALAACRPKKGPPPPPPPAVVKVLTLARQVVSLNTDLPRRTGAFKVADIRPQGRGGVQT